MKYWTVVAGSDQYGNEPPEYQRERQLTDELSAMRAAKAAANAGWYVEVIDPYGRVIVL